MKIPHKTHGWTPDRTDPAWAERVEVEAERHTLASERAYAKAAQRLARAEAKAWRAEMQNAPRRRVADLWAEVERRRAELLRLRGIMESSPAGAQHRGRGSHRGIGTGDTL